MSVSWRLIIEPDRLMVRLMIIVDGKETQVFRGQVKRSTIAKFRQNPMYHDVLVTEWEK